MSAIYSVMLPSSLGPTRNPFNYERIEQINRDVTTTWLTLAEMRDQVNLFDDTSQDTYLSDLGLAIRMAIEDYLGASFATVSYRVYYALESLYGNPLALDVPTTLNGTPTITKVAYYASGMPPVETVLDPSVYFYDLSGNRIVISSMPDEINTSVTNPIWIEYDLADDPVATYPVVRHAGKLLLTHLYNNRSLTTSKQQVVIPWGIDTLLRPYKPLIL
jgi:hypothetical protein